MAVINHRLDLVIRLIDASTGRPVDERNCSFARNGEPFRMTDKGGGVYFLINAGREDFELLIDIYGYEAKKVFINYGELNERLPEKIIWLLPERALSLDGTLKGIRSICAVRLVTPSCFVSSYDTRKNVLTLFNPHRLTMMHHKYGILGSDSNSFEPIYLNEEDGMMTIKPVSPLKRQPGVNDPIERIIEGEVFDDGRYCLRLRDDADRIEVLVRFEVEDREFFQKVEMHETVQNELDPAKAFEVSDVPKEEVKEG